MTKIEWAQNADGSAGKVWNPIVGCSLKSPGCTHCYAMVDAYRKGFNPVTPQYHGLTTRVNGHPVWTGEVRLVEHKLAEPLQRQKPTTWFVNSMSDLFHESVPDEWIDRVFAVMALAPQHTFQVLTKRAERMRTYFDGGRDRADIVGLAMLALVDRIPHGHRRVAWPLPNVWLGVSAERQKEADERIPLLLDTPAAVRWISAEPLLGPIDLRSINHRGVVGGHSALEDRGLGSVDWVVAGGESGPNARPMSIQWARELRDQCAATGVPYFFKQWGNWKPAGLVASGTPGRFAFGDYEHDRSAMIQVDEYPRQFTKFGARSVMERVGKSEAGRMLDGREYNGMPERAT